MYDFAPDFQVSLIKKVVDKYNRRLSSIAESIIKQCLGNNIIRLQSLHSCRCISPGEKKINEFHFRCKLNAGEKGRPITIYRGGLAVELGPGRFGNEGARNYASEKFVPTRVTDHTATLIDHVFLREQKQSEKIISGNIFTDISDHFANFLVVFDLDFRKRSIERRKTRIFGPKNTSKFLDNLQQVDWDPLYQETDVNRCATAFYNIVKKVYNEAFPLKPISTKRIKDKPCSPGNKCLFWP